ncbi:MAG: NgoFVII family restriction endonuclease [Proteobacteria bacterium]|nr:NgoFVII family restriction endonuclease [Pseudomonadota bacterium]
MLFYENLEDIIFSRHEIIHDADKLIILSGYLGPKPVEKLKELPIPSHVIYGMYGSDGISNKLHRKLLESQTESPDNLEISYSKLPIHSKCYMWMKQGKVIHALVGSANFSSNGLCTPYRETLAETTRDTFRPLNSYCDKILESSIKCSDYTEKKIIKKDKEVDKNYIFNRLDLYSTTKTGNIVPEKSGLNWGLSSGHTAQGDAYIKISKDMIKSQTDLFSPIQSEPVRYNSKGKAKRNSEYIEIIWDDGVTMTASLEGTQKHNGIKYPKQISSAPKKNIMGKYLRKRLNVSLDKLITMNDLNKYGRDNISIERISEGVYYFDFSI